MTVVDRSRTPPVRTPDPLASSRRRALRRLGSLRTMALGAIGDIGSNAFSTVSTLTWNTATDWNNAVDSSGVTNDSYGDLPATDVITMGVPTSFAGGSAGDLWALWPMDEDSGSTGADVSGNGRDLTYSGTTVVSGGGIGGTDARDLDGVDDEADSGQTVSISGSFSWGAWFNSDDVSTPGQRIVNNDSNNDGAALSLADPATGELRFFIRGKSETSLDTSTANLTTGTWYFTVAVYDASGPTRYIYLDGAEEASLGGDTGTPDSGSASVKVGADPANTKWLDGTMDYPFVATKALSPAEITDLYNAGSSSGAFLTTATKSFSTATQPDLQNLVYSLNGGSITLDVIGSPGSGSEEIVTQSLDGSTGFGLTWSSTHNDFRIRVEPSIPNPTATAPTVSQLELSS